MRQPIDILLSVLTDYQLESVYGKVWDQMTEGDGYQPWGYDRATLMVTNPEHLATLDRIKEEANARKEARLHAANNGA